MIPILSIVGLSNSGKTTLLVEIVKELTARGFRVATIKHDAHSFDIDHKGKDSWRHKQSGAVVSVISSPAKIAVVQDTNRDHSLADIRETYIRYVDIIVSEGYKREDHPKIEVYRKELGRDPLCSDDAQLVAIAGDFFANSAGAPALSLNNPAALCDFIEERFALREKSL